MISEYLKFCFLFIKFKLKGECIFENYFRHKYIIEDIFVTLYIYKNYIHSMWFNIKKLTKSTQTVKHFFKYLIIFILLE